MKSKNPHVFRFPNSYPDRILVLIIVDGTWTKRDSPAMQQNPKREAHDQHNNTENTKQNISRQESEK